MAIKEAIKVQAASIATMSLLSLFLGIILAAATIATHSFSMHFIIAAIILMNLLLWLFGPFFQTLFFKWFYKVRFYKYEELQKEEWARFLKKLCDEKKIRFPGIGIIEDDNPTAFSYGSASFNARIVLTRGMWKFLSEPEVESVLAHELGHIVHRDFIIMTIASTIVQLFYVIFRFLAGGRKKGDDRRGIYLLAIGLVSYFFYWIGTYALLFLSRAREYYADQFAAEKTDPNVLSAALIKIAYGIAAVEDTDKTAHLLNQTRAMGLIDPKRAYSLGLIYLNSEGQLDKLKKAFLFDLVNPWAMLMELSSTHPLTGKRLKKLAEQSKKPLFSLSAETGEVDKSRMWRGFFTDILIQNSFIISGIIMLTITLFLGVFIPKSALYPLAFMVTLSYLAVLIALIVIKTGYKFSGAGFQQMQIIDAMADIYASPVRGKPVRLSGIVFGRGVPGYIFGEDMMYRDRTGFIFLNYESAFPIFGNLYFAWKKLEGLYKKPSQATGWFFRGVTQHIELKELEFRDDKIKSRVKFWFIFWETIAAILLAALFLIISLFMAAVLTYAKP
ncbi:M48 family metalloprotease [Candidatus Woesearchaeota archaeon]|nr:M48 family metalloprotease [Candidatus Woesearchaeota archaeon]